LAITDLILAGWALLDGEGLARNLAIWKTAVGREDSPLVIDSPQAFSRVGTILQVFQTGTPYDGGGPAGFGRSAMHNACHQVDPSSHFCILQEMENAWKTSGVSFQSAGLAWIDNAVVGTVNSNYDGNFQNFSDWYGGDAVGDHPYNCEGWTNADNLARGLILNNGAISVAVEACDDVQQIACCR